MCSAKYPNFATLSTIIHLLKIIKAYLDSLSGESVCYRRCHSPIRSERCSFLCIFSNQCQKVAFVNHQQECLINGIFHAFDIKSNYLDPVIPKNLKNFEKLVKQVIKCKKVFL